VTPFLPYPGVPHAGGMLVFESVKRLSERHEVCLLSRVEPFEEKHIEDIRPFCKELYLYTFKTPPSRNPFSIIFSYIILGLKANRLLKEKGFDLVQAEFTETGFAMRRPRIPSVLVAHDVISKPAKRRLDASKGLREKFFNSLKFRAIRLVESFISRKFDRVLVMSGIDRDILVSLDRSIRAEVSPHPLQLDFESDIESAGRETGTLLFAGAMHRDVNIEAVLHFCGRILPLIREKCPDVKLYIAGNNPPEAVRRLAESDRNIVVTGFVNDLRGYFLKSTVFVSPLLTGGGIIVKNLQAMSCGLPVVTTSIGNEGIEAVSGRDLFVADAPEDFADKVLMLLRDPGLRREISLNGRGFARERFSDDRLFEGRIKLYEQLLGR